MSDGCANDRDTFMAKLIEEDVEAWARLQGLLAMLALPPMREDDGVVRRILVEIEVSPNKWVPIEGVTIEPHRLIFHYGTNGTRVQYPYAREDGIPRWRTPRAKRPTHGYLEG